MQAVKIVVLGAYGVGKRTFIHTIDRNTPSEVVPISSMFGRLEVHDYLSVYFFGIPPDPEHEHILPILAESATGFILMIDSTAGHSLDTGLRFLQMALETSNAPYVIVANKQDLPDAAHPTEVSAVLNDNYTVVPCIATDLDSVKHALLAVIDHPEIVQKIRSL